MWHDGFTNWLEMLTVFGFFFGVAVLIANNAKKKREAELLRIAIEKGQKIPEFEMPRSSKYGTLKAALIFLAIGIGFLLMVVFEEMLGYGEISLGLIPLFVGIALLASWAIERKLEKDRKEG
ncbi:MAG: DUF6249 domain-containing protein [candidate division Zixibacteria bacterium]